MAEPLRNTDNDAETNAAADRALRRRKGRKQITRAVKSYRTMSEQADKCQEVMRAYMRAYSDVFTEKELVEMSPESRPTVRKHVLGLDLQLPDPGAAGSLQLENDGTGENGQADVGSPDGATDAR